MSFECAVSVGARASRSSRDLYLRMSRLQEQLATHMLRCSVVPDRLIRDGRNIVRKSGSLGVQARCWDLVWVSMQVFVFVFRPKSVSSFTGFKHLKHVLDDNQKHAVFKEHLDLCVVLDTKIE